MFEYLIRGCANDNGVKIIKDNYVYVMFHKILKVDQLTLMTSRGVDEIRISNESITRYKCAPFICFSNEHGV